MEKTERRKSVWRRDLNDAVRDESGRVSMTKVGGIAGQWIAAKMLLENSDKVIANWDSMTVLFSVLIAPELIKKMVIMKYGNEGNK